MAGPEAALHVLPRTALAQSGCVRIWRDRWGSKWTSDGVVTAEPRASDQLWETRFPGEFLRVGGSGQEVSAPQGKVEMEALQGEDPTCHITSLILDSWLALGLHFEDETGSE